MSGWVLVAALTETLEVEPRLPAGELPLLEALDVALQILTQAVVRYSILRVFRRFQSIGPVVCLDDPVVVRYDCDRVGDSRFRLGILVQIACAALYS